MCYPYCHCNGRGYPYLMKKTIIMKWIAGSQHEVTRFTCPVCGRSEIMVDSHGSAVSASRMAELEAS